MAPAAMKMDADVAERVWRSVCSMEGGADDVVAACLDAILDADKQMSDARAAVMRCVRELFGERAAEVSSYGALDYYVKNAFVAHIQTVRSGGTISPSIPQAFRGTAPYGDGRVPYTDRGSFEKYKRECLEAIDCLCGRMLISTPMFDTSFMSKSEYDRFVGANTQYVSLLVSARVDVDAAAVRRRAEESLYVSDRILECFEKCALPLPALTWTVTRAVLLYAPLLKRDVEVAVEVTTAVADAEVTAADAEVPITTGDFASGRTRGRSESVARMEGGDPIADMIAAMDAPFTPAGGFPAITPLPTPGKITEDAQPPPPPPPQSVPHFTSKYEAMVAYQKALEARTLRDIIGHEDAEANLFDVSDADKGEVHTLKSLDIRELRAFFVARAEKLDAEMARAKDAGENCDEGTVKSRKFLEMCVGKIDEFVKNFGSDESKMHISPTMEFARVDLGDDQRKARCFMCRGDVVVEQPVIPIADRNAIARINGPGGPPSFDKDHYAHPTCLAFLVYLRSSSKKGAAVADKCACKFFRASCPLHPAPAATATTTTTTTTASKPVKNPAAPKTQSAAAVAKRFKSGGGGGGA